MHYFASQYYTAQGLLSDRSRIYRRKARGGAALATNSDADVGVDADMNVGTDDLFAEDVEDSENAIGGDDCCKESTVKDREAGEGKCLPSESVPDMYRALDGSALMAIGTPISLGSDTRN